MAVPIALEISPRDPAAELRSRLEQAPAEHAEALLAAYEVLQAMHEQGVLDILRAGLSAKDELLQMAVTAANTPEAIRAIRNLLFLRSVLGGIEPEWFKGLFQAIPEGIAQATVERKKPVAIWQILRRACSRDSLRAMAAGVDFLEAFGRHLHSLKESPR
jgi:uncharacterized protein YjgD (DUF1641 family)